jgi:DNA-binding NtrC family response regulator
LRVALHSSFVRFAPVDFLWITLQQTSSPPVSRLCIISLFDIYNARATNNPPEVVDQKMSTPWQVLVASSDLENRRALTSILVRLGLDPFCVSAVSQCREVFTREIVGLVFSDPSLSDGDYRDILAASKSGYGQPYLVLTCRHTHSDYREAIGSGVFDVITAPCRPTDVEWMVIQARRDEHQRFKPGPEPAITGRSRVATKAY